MSRTTRSTSLEDLSFEDRPPDQTREAEHGMRTQSLDDISHSVRHPRFRSHDYHKYEPPDIGPSGPLISSPSTSTDRPKFRPHDYHKFQPPDLSSFEKITLTSPDNVSTTGSHVFGEVLSSNQGQIASFQPTLQSHSEPMLHRGSEASHTRQSEEQGDHNFRKKSASQELSPKSRLQNVRRSSIGRLFGLFRPFSDRTAYAGSDLFRPHRKPPWLQCFKFRSNSGINDSD